VGRLVRCRGATIGGLLLAALVSATSSQAAAAANLRVRGNQLIDGSGVGHAVQLRGVNRAGLEYACIHGWGFFDSPHPDRIDDPSMIAAMKRWDINVVRVPLNEDCWLNVNTPLGRGGAPYRRIVERYVHALNSAGLYVILELHLAAPGRVKAEHLEWMPDRDHAPEFWNSLARTFKNNHALIFDLYNEPNHVGWSCWLAGCGIPAYNDGYGQVPAYQAVGMQRLVDAVRGVGARQPLLLGGIVYSRDLSQFLANVPRDPLHQLVASDHNYGGLNPCNQSCRTAILATHRRVPVVFGELGETDCRHGYIDSMMRFADAQGIGYLGWAWDAVSRGGWSCSGGPSLIKDYHGTPTAFGIGLRDHLRALGMPFKPL
jgi:endoglucanase